MIYLLLNQKEVKLEKEEHVNFRVKPIPGDGHDIVNCFSMFFGKDSSEFFFFYYGTNFRKTFTYTWVSVNRVVPKNFSKAWKNISLTSAITRILSVYFLRLCQKSPT